MLWMMPCAGVAITPMKIIVISFFECPLSNQVWRSLRMPTLVSVADTELWSFPPPTGLGSAVWPSLLQALLWRLWDARNRAVFRSEQHTSRNVISRVCDDLSIWDGRFVSASLVPSLRRWRVFFTTMYLFTRLR